MKIRSKILLGILMPSILAACSLEEPLESCVPYEKLCENNIYYECLKNGKSLYDENCSKENKICHKTLGCVECMPNMTSCQNSMIKTCLSDGSWGELSTCPNAQKCQDDEIECTKLVSICTPNEKQCQDSILLTCLSDGSWDDGILCANNASCKNATSCNECLDETTKCKDGMLKTCVSGAYDAGTQCIDASDQAVSCKDETTCGDCLNEAIKCENKTEVMGEFEVEIGHLISCTNGSWQDASATRCTPRSSCSTNALACGKCINNAVQCGTTEGDLDYVYICVEGAYVKANTQCSLKCENGLCVNE